MIQINKNNLSKDLSPYLKQHKDNPVHWQTWSKNSLEFAKQNKKPILLSIGYASCHWELFHPINGKKMKFEAELPKEFQKLLKVLKN